MSASTSSASPPRGGFALGTLAGVALRYIGLLIVDALAVWLSFALLSDQEYTLVIAIVIITVFVNVVNIRDDLYPIRWMAPGLSLMALLVIYPIFFTFYVAFTNYGDGHLFTKAVAVEILEESRRYQYVPEDAELYEFSLYQNDAGEYAIWLIVDEESGIFAYGEQPLLDVVPFESGVGDYVQEDSEFGLNLPLGLPLEIEGYSLVTERPGFIQALTGENTLEGALFGEAENAVQVKSASLRNTQAGRLLQRYEYDADADAITDVSTGVVYTADNEIGRFVSVDDERLDVGFWVTIGLDNFARFFGSSQIAGPLLQVFIWTVVFAFMSVFTTFAGGLFFALLLNTRLPGKRFFRTILIVPYAIPALIAVAIWKGMLNPNFGILPEMITMIFGSAPSFFDDANWAKFAILVINFWLGYPYFMLVCSGALAAIPSDMYEAAEVDGATAFEQFRFLTLPMLLVAVGPLLIASFTYNFNNFALIEVYNEGKPPIPGAETPAGYTDILISYTYRLAFSTGRGADYGLASAITIVIFIMVASVTLLQFRFTKQWEEVSDNV